MNMWKSPIIVCMVLCILSIDGSKPPSRSKLRVYKPLVSLITSTAISFSHVQPSWSTYELIPLIEASQLKHESTSSTDVYVEPKLSTSKATKATKATAAQLKIIASDYRANIEKASSTATAETQERALVGLKDPPTATDSITSTQNTPKGSDVYIKDDASDGEDGVDESGIDASERMQDLQMWLSPPQLLMEYLPKKANGVKDIADKAWENFKDAALPQTFGALMGSKIITIV
jgi:hypothetical protein